jgi:hypothetical protein
MAQLPMRADGDLDGIFLFYEAAIWILNALELSEIPEISKIVISSRHLNISNYDNR